MARKKKTTFENVDSTTKPENNVGSGDADELALSNEGDTQPAPPVAETPSNILSEAEDIVADSIEDATSDNVVNTDELSLGDETDTQPATPVESSVEASNPNGTEPIVLTPDSSPTYSNSATNGATDMVSNTPVSSDDYQVMPEAPWPPPIFVKRNITPQERYYLEHRWYSQWRFFDNNATKNKKRYYLLQGIVVIGSVTVPALVGVNSDLFADLFPFLLTTESARNVVSIVTIFVSLAVALAAALESLYKHGENWGSYRQAAEELQAEKSFYDVNAGRYANNPNAFSRFVERTEEIIAQQNGRFVATVEKQVQETEKRTEEALGKEGKEDDVIITETQSTYQQSVG